MVKIQISPIWGLIFHKYTIYQHEMYWKAGKLSKLKTGYITRKTQLSLDSHDKSSSMKCSWERGIPEGNTWLTYRFQSKIYGIPFPPLNYLMLQAQKLSNEGHIFFWNHNRNNRLRKFKLKGYKIIWRGNVSKLCLI